MDHGQVVVYCGAALAPYRCEVLRAQRRCPDHSCDRYEDGMEI
jgi:hypothetical protein